MAGTAPCPSIKPAISESLGMCSSFQMPRHRGVIRPSGDTALISTVTWAAPPTAREPKWTRCQLVAKPSPDEYWHIGETTIRWRNVTLLSVNGVKRDKETAGSTTVAISGYSNPGTIILQHAVQLIGIHGL